MVTKVVETLSGLAPLSAPQPPSGSGWQRCKTTLVAPAKGWHWGPIASQNKKTWPPCEREGDIEEFGEGEMGVMVCAKQRHVLDENRFVDL